MSSARLLGDLLMGVITFMVVTLLVYVLMAQ